MCYGPHRLDEIITIIISGSGIVIVVCICIIATLNLHSNDSRVHKPFKILFYTAVIGTLLSMSGSIASILICPQLGENVAYSVLMLGGFTGHLLLLSSLFISFVLRLYITFASSEWRVSKLSVSLFMVLVALMFFTEFIGSIVLVIGLIDRPTFFVISSPVLFAYISASVWPVYRFVYNLMALAKLRSTTVSSGNLTSDSGVSEKQQELIDLSSKYVALFIVAMSSTFFSFCMVSYMRLAFSEPLHPGAAWSLDCVVNIICLYLYHSFATTQYDRYCSRLDLCCKSKMKEDVRMENIESITRRSDFSSRSPDIPASPSQSGVEHVHVPRAPDTTRHSGGLVILDENIYEMSDNMSPSPRSKSPSTGSQGDIIYDI